VDEAYQPFAGSTYLDRLEEYPNLVVLRTLSKLGLAGIRLGYAAGRPEWIREFDKVRSPYNVNVLTQIVAERVLAHYDVLERQAAAIRADRESLATELARMPGFSVFPSRANFLLVRVPDATKLFEELQRRNVLVKNVHGAHPVLEQCLRITIGTPAENQLLMSALKAGIDADANGTAAGVRVR
jgi:histidinol-phosphate aminotransferase